MNNPVDAINRSIAETHKNMRYVQDQLAESKRKEIERQERNNELLEINVEQNEEMLGLQRAELEFLENIDGNTAILVGILEELEKTNKTSGSLTQENLLAIKQRLDEIIGSSNSQNISQLFIEEAKKQIVEKGVSYGLQFIIVGVKLLFKANAVE